jgi:hypothetical protein
LSTVRIPPVCHYLKWGILMFEWKGKPVIVTKEAMTEMDFLEIYMWDAIEILECGFNCSSGRRGKEVFERCMRKGKKVLKIVAVDRSDVIKIIHAGKFSSKRWKNESGKDETHM